MTEAMPFLQKAILLSYAPRPFVRGLLFYAVESSYAPRPLGRGGILKNPGTHGQKERE